MPYLNWRTSALTQALGPHPKLQSELELGLSAAQRDELLQKLVDTFQNGAGELRLDLPRGWVVFWKLRDSDSRLLLAHPQQDEWVATVALEQAFAGKVLSALSGLGAGGAVNVSGLGPLGAMSNVDVKISVA